MPQIRRSHATQANSVCSRVAGRRDDARLLAAEGLAILAFMQIQLCRRTWECFAVTRWGSSCMHPVAYLVRTDSALRAVRLELRAVVRQNVMQNAERQAFIVEPGLIVRYFPFTDATRSVRGQAT